MTGRVKVVRPGRKRVVVSMAVLGILVLGAAAVALRRPILEQWFIRELESDDERVARAASEKLGELRSLRAVPYLLRWTKELQAENPSIFSRGGSGPLRSLFEMRELDKPFEKRHRDEQWEKNWAGQALTRIGARAVPLMIDCLRSDSYVKSWVKEVFVRMGSEALPALLEAMNSSDSRVRAVAADVLGRFEASEGVVDALRRAALDWNDAVRLLTVQSLGNIGPGAKAAVPELIEVALTGSGLSRNKAIDALGWIGPDAGAAAKVLTGLLQDEDPAIQRAAARALANIRGEPPPMIRHSRRSRSGGGSDRRLPRAEPR